MIDLSLKLEDVLDHWSYELFFSYLNSEGIVPTYLYPYVADEDDYVDLDKLIQLDNLVVTTYGLRRISRYLSRITVHDEEHDTYTDDPVILWKFMLSKFNEKWQRLYDALFAEYNPIDNYNMVEDENAQTQVHNESDQGVKTYGFNSTDPVPTGEGHVESDMTGDFDKNHRKMTRKGNIGVTTSQKMVSEEIELRKHQFIDIVITDIGEFLTRPQY